MGNLEIKDRQGRIAPPPPLAQRDVAQPPDVATDSYSDRPNEGQNICAVRINPGLFAQGTPRTGGIIRDLWSAAEDAIRQKLALRCYSAGDIIEIDIGKDNVSSNGFRLHGIKLCFGPSSQASAKMKFRVKDDGGLTLIEMKLMFTRPVIAALNLGIPKLKGIGAFFREGRCLSEATALSLADEGEIKPYDRKDAGTFTKPILLAYDTVNMFIENGRPTVFLELASKGLTSKGWGTFTFGADEDSCEEKGRCVQKNSRKNPGYFLGDMEDENGDELGSDACRNTIIGGVIRKAIVKWIMGDWGDKYNEFMSMSGNDPLISFAATVNVMMDTGTGGCDYGELQKEEDILGRAFNIWISR